MILPPLKTFVMIVLLAFLSWREVACDDTSSGQALDDGEGEPIDNQSTTTNSTMTTAIPDDPSTCVSTVLELNERLAVPRQNITELRTVTLCPNTCIIYSPELGRPGSRLFLTNANTHIRCGEDGKLSNNCTLATISPKQITLATIVVAQGNLDGINNMKLSGVTFDGLFSRGWAATLAFSGFVVFDNCAFQVRNVSIGQIRNVPNLPNGRII